MLTLRRRTLAVALVLLAGRRAAAVGSIVLPRRRRIGRRAVLTRRWRERWSAVLLTGRRTV